MKFSESWLREWVNPALDSTALSEQLSMAGLEVERVMQGLAILETQARGEQRDLRLVADYSMPNVADKVVRIIHSYRDYVMRTVWKQY